MYNFYSRKLIPPPYGIRKLLLVMKITTLMLFLAIMQVSATSLAQKVSIKASNQPLSAIFDQISTQTGYDFAYTTKTLENAKPVTINVKNEELDQVLKKIFDGQPLEFTIKDRFVTVTVKQPTIFDKIKSALNLDKIEVHGTVIDENGQPLSGATVIVKGTSNSTITDANGEFTLTKVPAGATLVISYVGYDKKELTAAESMGIIQMKVASSQLDAVQVIAYGETMQRFSVGNVTTVKGEDIQKQPVNNPLLALEGRVPGLFITQGSGIPGAGVTVRIQGQNSIANGNDPFYVVDGVPYTQEWFGTGKDGILQAGAANGNPLSYINPDDIESISVLKDANATAIYGSRAANGAILITTKKGKAGETKINVSLQNGWGEVTRKLDLLNTQQYLAMRHEALKNDGIALPSATDYDVNGLWDTTRYTNWQKVLIGGTSLYTHMNTSISGGTSSTQYLIGGTYHRETTVFPGDFSDQKGTIHYSINTASANGRFHIQLRGNYMLDYNQLPNKDFTQSTYLSPDAPALYNKDGTLNWEPNAAGNSTWKNPFAQLYNTYTNKTTNLISSAILSYNILPGLDIKSSFDYTNMQTDDYSPFPLAGLPPERRSGSRNSASYGERNFNSWTIEPQLSYKKNIYNGKLDILLGSTILESNSKLNQFTGVGYSSDQVLQDIAAAAKIYSYSIISKYNYNALFGRLNYNLLDKYIIDLNVRRDGSSRFGPKNEFHNFGSIGAAWLFGEEHFIKKSDVISYGKLRASYGTTGNDQIGDYKFINLYNFFQNYGLPYQGGTGLTPAGLPNPYLQWEETKKLQAGIDLGFLKDKLLLSVDYSRNRSSNQLLSYSLPSITGFTSILRNFPATVQNVSWEYTLTSTNIKAPSLSWSTNFNVTVPQNKLISFPNLASSSYASTLVIGQPASVLKVFHSLGVDPSTGAYKFASKTDPFNPVYPDDATVLINTMPKFYGGLQNNLTFKGFELSFLFQFVKQIGPNIYFNNGGYPPPGVFYYSYSNQPVTVLNHWQNPGNIVPIAQYSSQLYGPSQYAQQLSYLQGSDAAYSDASYIRLKNVALSWKFPDAWNKKVGVQNCSIFLQGQNLLTFTNYKGWDPENQGFLNLPPLRITTIGIRLGL